jgi:ankyrin repeat protein
MIEDGGFDVNEQTEYMALAMDYSCSWHTPLHLAAMYGQPKVMRLLVEAGADVDAYDSKETLLCSSPPSNAGQTL